MFNQHPKENKTILLENLGVESIIYITLKSCDISPYHFHCHYPISLSDCQYVTVTTVFQCQVDIEILSVTVDIDNY